MSRFVKGGTSVLTLANGDTLIVKKRLNRGELADAVKRLPLVELPSGKYVHSPMDKEAGMVAAYLLDWQLQDDDQPIAGLSIDDKETVLNNLDPDDFAEINAAIEAHEAKVTAERAAAKKPQGGVSGSSAISPSAAITAGASTTSEA